MPAQVLPSNWRERKTTVAIAAKSYNRLLLSGFVSTTRNLAVTFRSKSIRPLHHLLPSRHRNAFSTS